MKFQPTYVLTECGDYLLQIPYDVPFGFALVDDDQTFPGGIGVAKRWQKVDIGEVPRGVRDRLDWIIEEEEES